MVYMMKINYVRSNGIYEQLKGVIDQKNIENCITYAKFYNIEFLYL